MWRVWGGPVSDHVTERTTNAERALSEAKNMLSRKKHLLTTYPQLYSLKSEINMWELRVKDLESQLEEGLHET